MKKVFRSYNDFYCTLAMEEFFRLGVRDVFIAPGSRSTPLVFAAEENAKLLKHVHFDERGLGFWALGSSKKSSRPVVIITTSGTAASNLYSAIVEAGLTHTPLIVCTADRPFELRGTGANQAIDQVQMFNHTKAFFEMPCPSSDLTPESWLTTLDEAVRSAASFDGGSVHVNWMFREPLVPPSDGILKHKLTPMIEEWLKSGKSYSQSRQALPLVTLDDDVKQLIQSSKNGVIVVGAQGDLGLKSQDLENIKWPVFADIQSSLRLNSIPNLISHWDLLLEVEDFKPDCVVWLGGAVTNKKGLEFFRNLHCPIIQCYPTSDRLDPHHLSKIRIQGLSHALLSFLGEQNETRELSSLLEKNHKILDFLEQEIGGAQDKITEPFVVYQLSKRLKKGNIFLGSSRPIRDFQRFARAENSGVNVFTNRGASGIDGTFATCAGLALQSGSDEVTVGVLGDLALLHDLNSLSLARHAKGPLLVVVINNDGGGIFSFLPVAQHKEIFEKYWGTPHGYDFSQFARGFGLNYLSVKTGKEFLKALDTFDTATPLLVEVKTDRGDNFDFHSSVIEKLKKQFCP